MKRLVFLLLVSLVSATAHAADGPCVIPGRGYFRIHVGTGGLFGAFAHDHLIEAQKMEGCATLGKDGLAQSSIKLAFPSAELRVVNSKENAKDTAEVQKNMETDVLRVSEYPRITFESTSVESGGTDQVRVHGNLTIRGKTVPVVIPVQFTHQDGGIYRAVGKYNFKQTSFGITPIKIGGGAVKVKDELQTEFEIFLK